MALINWNTNYSVGIREIDDQHKKLISLINELYEAMRRGEGKAALGQVLGQMLDYTVYHFNSEERLFREYGYPDHEEHKQMHDYLSDNVRQLKAEYEAGSPAITRDAMLFLSNWLNVHILEVDKRYGPYLHSKGVQ